MLGSAAPMAAQVTYNVFPADPSNSPAAMAQPTKHGTTPRVTLVVRDSTIEYVVNEVARQIHLRPFYDNHNPMFAKRIAVQMTDVSVADAFVTVLKGTGLEAKVTSDGETVVIRGRGGLSPAERARVAGGMIVGKVTDSAGGQGLSGASVRVAGTKLSAVTSDSGNFTLRDVPSGDQLLVARLFSYKPAERTVTVVDSQRTMVRMVMVPVPTVLSGVVTTATGVQRKIEVGNDITSLNVDSIMRVAPVTSVTDLLETRVPGLTVTHSSGEPGAPSRLRLRGIGSISGNNDPIFIIDGVRVYSNQSDTRNDNLAPSPNLSYSASGATAGGVTQRSGFAAPSPIDQIDPSSIETIEVFKGPSASALYGSDAANGVVVITTKHGRAGPTHWSLGLGQGVNWIPGNWPTNVFRFGVNIRGVGPVCNWYDPTCVAIDSVRSFQALNDSRYTVLSHGGDQTASLTITGGVPTLQYSITGSSSGTQGNLTLPKFEQQQYSVAYGSVPGWMVRPDNQTTWGMNGSLTASPYQKIQVSLQSSLFNGAQQTSSLSGALPELEGVYIAGGYVTDFQGGVNSLATNSLVNNFVERVNENSETSQNALSLSWTPLAWLPITATGGIQTIQRTDQSYIPYGVNNAGPNVCAPVSNCVGDTTGYYGLGRGLSRNQTLAIGTTGIPLFHQRVALAVGGNLYSETTNDFQASTNQLAPGVSTPTSFFTLCGTVNCGTATQGSSSSSTYGWYFEPRINMNSRLFVAPGFRLDGGSGGTHATTSGGATGGLSAFPKLDLSYVAVNRQSSQPLWGFLTLLRPRVAFGLAGTQPSPQDRLRLFNLSDGSTLNPGGEGNIIASNAGGCSPILPYNGTTVSGVCLNTLGNTQLRPERSSELEGGFDANLWNNRIQLTYTQYNKTRKDAIIDIPIAPSISVPGGSQFTIAENIGEVRNTGTELTVSAIILQSRALSWNVGANLSNDNNLLVHLNQGQAPNYTLGLVPGYPLFGQWVRPIAGFSDLNHNGIIEQNEISIGDSLVFAGQPNPKYELNLNTGVTLLSGRLSMNATFAYQKGMSQNNEVALNSTSFYTLGNNPSTPLSYQAAIVATTCLIENHCTLPTTTSYGLIQTVNTFRFNDLSINYELPRSLSSWLKVPRASVALQGSNLALHTNYRGKDPDVNAFSTVSSVDETADLGQVPEPRTWWLKLTLGN